MAWRRAAARRRRRRDHLPRRQLEAVGGRSAARQRREAPLLGRALPLAPPGHAAPLSSSGLGSCARRRAAELSVDAFVEDFERAGVPVVIEGAAADAAAGYLGPRRFAGPPRHARVPRRRLRVRAGGVSPIRGEQRGRHALYLFDKRFAEAAQNSPRPTSPQSTSTTTCSGSSRPAARLALAHRRRRAVGQRVAQGPQRHVGLERDAPRPQAVAVFPPRTTPPGVRPSADGLTSWRR